MYQTKETQALVLKVLPEEKETLVTSPQGGESDEKQNPAKQGSERNRPRYPSHLHVCFGGGEE